MIWRTLLALMMTAMGAMHFLYPAPFAHVVPSYLPHPVALVLWSGLFEILGGIGLLPIRTRRAAGIGLVALFIAVFPANVNMALSVPAGTSPIVIALLWARLPLQLLLIWWVLRVSRPQARSLLSASG